MTEHFSVTGKAPAARPRRMVVPLPFDQRETCSMRTATELSGISRSKLYSLIGEGCVKTIKVDG
jgi:hypothetical protein